MSDIYIPPFETVCRGEGKVARYPDGSGIIWDAIDGGYSAHLPDASLADLDADGHTVIHPTAESAAVALRNAGYGDQPAKAAAKEAT